MAKVLFTYSPVMEALVYNGNPMGGSLVQTMVWMRALHELGHEVYLAKFENDNRPIRDEFNWIRLVDLYHPDKFKKRLVWFTYRLPKYYFLLRRNLFDCTYISMPHWSVYFTGLISNLLGVRQILRLANDNNLDRNLGNKNTRIQNFFQDLGFSISTLVVAQNEFQFSFLKSKYRVKKLAKISNPIVLDKNYLRIKKQYFGYIAWAANFRRQKNLALLFELAELLSDEHFCVAGQPLVPMDEESATFYEKLKALPNVEFVGVLDRKSVLDFFDKAKFLLSTSRYEGFSNTFLESMVVGTPILTTSNVNPDRIISDHDLGIVYSSTTDLQNALASMTSEKYLRMSENCIAYVREHHDHLKLGKKLIDLVFN